MMSGSNAPWAAAGPASSEELESARGAVRDTLGSLRNAEQLLRSLKVGPKALSSVLPLLYASCRPLAESWRDLSGALMLRAPDCARALDVFVTPRIEELEAALARNMSAPINAKQRLGLEQVLARTAADLDTARGLLELLEEAFSAAPAVVDLWELTRETFQAGDSSNEPSAEVVCATLEKAPGVELKVSPRVAMALIAIGVRVVGHGDPGVPRLAIDRKLTGECGVTVSRSPGQGEALVLRPPRLIAPTLQCARTAARATQGRFEVAEDGSWASLQWAMPGD